MGKRKIGVARELGVSAPAVFNAEERPELPLHKLRHPHDRDVFQYKVVGPVYYLKRK